MPLPLGAWPRGAHESGVPSYFAKSLYVVLKLPAAQCGPPLHAYNHGTLHSCAQAPLLCPSLLSTFCAQAVAAAPTANPHRRAALARSSVPCLQAGEPGAGPGRPGGLAGAGGGAGSLEGDLREGAERPPRRVEQVGGRGQLLAVPGADPQRPRRARAARRRCTAAWIPQAACVFPISRSAAL